METCSLILQVKSHYSTHISSRYSDENHPSINVSNDGIANSQLKNVSHKAADPDELAPAVFKELSTVIAPVSQKIFTKSLETYPVPNDWKKAQITPTFKKGKRTGIE